MFKMEALDFLHELHDQKYVTGGQSCIVVNGRKVCLEVDEQLHEGFTPTAQEVPRPRQIEVATPRRFTFDSPPAST